MEPDKNQASEREVRTQKRPQQLHLTSNSQAAINAQATLSRQLRCPLRLFSTQVHSGDHSADEGNSDDYCSAQFSGGGDNSGDLSDDEKQLKEGDYCSVTHSAVNRSLLVSRSVQRATAPDLCCL
ncbi:unnamed protein product [Ilex paraguariensis]|uniref:Uncharacterized protein n=1 Tax=Ilex paraguariensis TaxID=185542 RepID=A0ABC8RB67_9AQUA